jgi:hypothetical protein
MMKLGGKDKEHWITNIRITTMNMRIMIMNKRITTMNRRIVNQDAMQGWLSDH